jgi:tetratricopeptide (TPR) repeat protein
LSKGDEDEGDLAPWLKQWEQNILSGQPVNQKQIAELEQILQHTELSCPRLTQIGHVVYALSEDRQTTVIFFAAAVVQGDHQLAAAVQTHKPVNEILSSMKNCESLMWEEIYHGNRRYLDNISMLDQDLEKYISPNDTSIGWMVPWAKIAQGDCLYVQGRYDEALAAAAKLEKQMDATSESFTQEQKADVHWLESLTLVSTNHLSEAVPHLRFAAENPEGGHWRSASYLLLDVLQKLGRDSDVQQCKQQLVAHGLPVADDVQ